MQSDSHSEKGAHSMFCSLIRTRPLALVGALVASGGDILLVAGPITILAR